MVGKWVVGGSESPRTAAWEGSSASTAILGTKYGCGFMSECILPAVWLKKKVTGQFSKIAPISNILSYDHMQVWSKSLEKISRPFGSGISFFLSKPPNCLFSYHWWRHACCQVVLSTEAQQLKGADVSFS